METFILAVMVFQLCLSLTYVSVGHRYGCFMDRNCMISFFLGGWGGKEDWREDPFLTFASSEAEVVSRWEHPWQRLRWGTSKNSPPSPMTNPHFY